MLYIYWGRILCVLFYGLLTLGILRGNKSLSDYFVLKKKQLALQNTVDSLNAEIHLLKQEIHRIEQSEEYAIKVLKDKYHVIEDNEELIFFDHTSP
ncbi:MAG: septum formation initiator family protein [Proteobacteria bacterium]|nr:septum formation initiator family protein [Pseudomonadota bacterium]